MSDSRPKSCPRHPESPIASAGPRAGECWTCAGRPPDWTCSQCGRRVGNCAHLDAVDFVSGAPPEAQARERLNRAILALVGGAGSWRVVERELTEFAREVRRAWGEKVLARSDN